MRRSIILMIFKGLLLLACSISASAMSIPERDQDFYLATDQLVGKYHDIARLHKTNLSKKIGLSVDNLTTAWGEPKQVKQNRGNLFGSIFVGVGTALLALPNPIAAIGLASGVGVLSYTRTQETMIWDKGDYLIEVNTRKSRRSSQVSSWIWKYKSLDQAVPIFSPGKSSKNYFQIGFGRGTEALMSRSSSYGNGQYFVLGHRVARLLDYQLFLEAGVNWGLPGKATPDGAHWVRIPLHMVVKTEMNANGFSYGAGLGYQIAKEFGSVNNDAKALGGARSTYAFIEYRFSPQLSFGIRENLQWIATSSPEHPLFSSQLASYASVRF
ncbi:MAG: hypothetical protein OEZ43_12120 [Gammaproteobacteria bacterium]|nr:hypothetical protein [Gammaproteobacteria bacterium]